MLQAAEIVRLGFRYFMGSENIENLSTRKNIVKTFDKFLILRLCRKNFYSGFMANRKSAGVSMDPEFETLAKRRASSLGLNFSTYVNQLIRRDLARKGELSVHEEPPIYGQNQSQSQRKKI